jgi:chromosome partitioning protein
LAAVGERVLLIDIDPQGNASTGLGLPRSARSSSIYDVLISEAPLSAVTVSSSVPGLDLVPADADLSGVEIELGSQPRRSFRLRNAIAGLSTVAGQAGPAYSYILIDCPPSLNLLTVNAMTAADAVLVPLQCEFFALEGLTQLLRTVELVRGSLNSKLEIQGLVLTMYDRRNSLSSQVEQDVRAHFGEKVYKTVIPRNVRVSEAPSYGKPALVYDLNCTGSQAYMRLASELIGRERDRRAAASAA